MAQMIVGSPFDELELSDKHRFQPPAFFHLFFGEPLAPSTAGLFRKVCEWARVYFQAAKALHQRSTNRRRKSASRTSGIHQLLAVVVPEHERVKGIASNGVTANYEIVTSIHAHFLPGSGSESRFVPL